VRIVAATRAPARVGLPEIAKYLTYGASPRATISLIEGARALALMRGRRYALPEDVDDLVHDVLRHRLVLSYEALAEGKSADAIVDAIVARVPRPEAADPASMPGVAAPAQASDPAAGATQAG
jgi:MoxR-like ATPase